ncbi:hypothetical protein [Terriglobus aquaticus]|uniref:Uncharacterized protein n=1 Tax=Terriglobus aquaticus TaxID=940139 RepID=A0ABW9KNW1_9BACT|nr:hypothetical protein [Terriglobus aquaticus]
MATLASLPVCFAAGARDAVPDLAVMVGASAPRPSPATPAYRIPLDTLGYRPVTAAMLLREGFAHNTLDFIDNDNVLLTFAAHKLVPREQDDPEGDQDRLIEAIVVHLPDGAVIRQAEWRVHDQARYLWPLTHGRFMLRIRNELFFVDPMRPHATMHRHSMLKPDGELAAIQVSPDGATVLIQTTPKRHIGDDPTQPLDHPPVQATFYRVSDDDHPQLLEFAKTEISRPVEVPFTSRGFLDVVKEDRQHWGFDFHPFAGGKIELAGLTSTCRPEAQWVSESTFVATGCRGMDDRRLLSGFDMLAQANWVFTTDDPPLWSALSTASGDSGRFAFRNAQEPSISTQDEDHPADHHTQTVRVYEFQGGVELLRVPVTPAQRAGLNFDLSPDGQHVAVLQDRTLEVYNLPPLSPENRREQAREQQALEKIAVPHAAKVRIGIAPTADKAPAKP